MATHITVRPADAAFAAPRYSPRRSDRHGLFWLFCLSSALDFRGQTAGGAIQTVLFLVSSLAFVLILLSARRPNIGGLQTLFRSTFAWWLYLIVSLPVALFWGVPLINYIKAFIPSLLMGESLIIGLLLIARSADNIVMILEAIYWSCLISSVVFLINGLFFLGFTIDNARFHITSPLLASLVAISLWSYCWRDDGRRFLYLASFVFALTIMYLSLTRTYIVAVGCVILTFVPVLFLRNPWYSAELRATSIKRAGTLGLVLTVVAVVVLIAFPSFAGRWSVRALSIGESDPTTLSRVAEAAGEIEQMESTMTRFVIGSGIGSDHLMDNVYLKDVEAWAGDDSINDAIWEPGHVLWPYQFYATGIVLGGFLPIIMVMAVWSGIRCRETYYPLIAASAVAGIFGESTFGNILGARSGGAMLGLLLSVALSGAVYKAQSRHAALRSYER